MHDQAPSGTSFSPLQSKVDICNPWCEAQKAANDNQEQILNEIDAL